MDKLKIKVVSLGHLPFKFDKYKIENWTSDVFEIVDKIETLKLPSKSDLVSHGYSDKSLSEGLPENFKADVLIAITNVPLELNWYSRRLSNNRICFSFFEMADILRPNNIPLENLVLRLFYSTTLIYKRHNNTLPDSQASTNFTHSDTRGCLFDFNGIKSDVIYSVIKPTLCDECTSKLQQEKVPKETIVKIKSELKKINRSIYYRVADIIKERPYFAMVISVITTLALSIAGSFIYDKWIKGLFK